MVDDVADTHIEFYGSYLVGVAPKPHHVFGVWRSTRPYSQNLEFIQYYAHSNQSSLYLGTSSTTPTLYTPFWLHSPSRASYLRDSMQILQDRKDMLEMRYRLPAVLSEIVVLCDMKALPHP